ncbi:MAG: B12-binding domain-containing radical SAM protein [Nitrospirae bacterium]|nr:B12-binding domain-containing radical SAM protein [Nitrospirota bacterium]
MSDNRLFSGSKKTDVLFIHPGDHKKTYQDLSKEFTAVATPAWTLLLADYSRRKGYATVVYDVNVEGWDENEAHRLLSKYDPELVVLMVYGHNPSASTQTMPAAGRIARDIKKYNKDVPIAMGGTHPSALPEKTLEDEDIDYVIQGEGAYTIESLLKYLKGGVGIKDVKGLWYIDDTYVKFTSPADTIKNLDEELENYAWDLLPDIRNYRAHNMHCFQDFEESKKDDFSDVRTPYVAMNTSLGCPYSCNYCCINAIFGKPGVRYWSLEKVLSWIDMLVNKYGVRNIRLDDELFLLSPARIERFCDLIIERGYDLNFWVYGRVDTIREALLKKLKKAGVNWICLGIESANEKVRKDVNKNIRQDVKDTVKLIQAHDIYVLGNYMFGLPEDDMDTMRETLEQARDINCEFVNFYSVMAFPGSKLYECACQNKWRLPENWGGFSQHGYETRPLPTKYLSARDVLKFRDEAFYEYYMNPAYLDMTEKRFGGKVRRHIEKMLDIKIRRKLLETIMV